jgi:low temperature requirement protein LtrA
VATVDGTALAGDAEYGLLFFLIWWAWVCFTCFASAYDTDDVPFRLLTLVHIAGVC